MNQTRLERIAKGQAKTLVHTLTLLDDEGYGDSDLSMLRGSIRRWLEHMTPLKKWNPVDERTYCVICTKNFDDDGFDYRFESPICHECVDEVRNSDTESKWDRKVHDDTDCEVE